MKAKLIAEPAIYWHGDQMILHNMIDYAAAAQCDMFKYQCFNPDRLSPAFQPKKKFYSKCQLDVKGLSEVKDHVEANGMEFVVTVNTPDRFMLMHELNVENIKIASGQIHPALLQEIAKHRWKRVMISTGMLNDCEKLDHIREIETADEVVVMHCVSLYPHNDNETNMQRMSSLNKHIGNETKNCIPIVYGYSDHTMDDLASVVAVSMGARYIERHFKTEACFGPTVQVCCSPAELANFSATLRRIDSIIGDGEMAMQQREWNSYEHYKNRFLL